ncbi:hypothetical protein CCACVL1_07386 [Corchorus capsularis]|uniref:ZF-HD dimerization-type domain-containing protein n=1 Tax=Corchorus capsularis TaxID=210143 RepID=A0A1R3J6C3_COCAP|nr:hypothetical protein CCACVL1_07386 [Corchorus capsularis]
MNNSSRSPRRNNNGGNGNGHSINVVSSGVSGPPSPSLEENNNNNGNDSIGRPSNFKKVAVRYRECLKNHAAAIGGNATDGCGEFMPSGEEGTLEALKCSACNCHRNFHRKEIQCDCPFPFDCYHNSAIINSGRKLILGPSQNYILASPAAAVTAAAPLMTSFKAGSSVPSETDEKDDNGGGGRVAAAKGSGGGKVRKRFRTKFSQEQKEKMLKFAEKAEWRIQKLDESVVQHFCQEIGIKRRVLKVWMHNNKQSLAKKLDHINVPGLSN